MFQNRKLHSKSYEAALQVWLYRPVRQDEGWQSYIPKKSEPGLASTRGHTAVSSHDSVLPYGHHTMSERARSSCCYRHLTKHTKSYGTWPKKYVALLPLAVSSVLLPRTNRSQSSSRKGHPHWKKGRETEWELLHHGEGSCQDRVPFPLNKH